MGRGPSSKHVPQSVPSHGTANLPGAYFSGRVLASLKDIFGAEVVVDARKKRAPFLAAADLDGGIRRRRVRRRQRAVPDSRSI